jgi:hypothetical protein
MALAAALVIAPISVNVHAAGGCCSPLASCHLDRPEMADV